MARWIIIAILFTVSGCVAQAKVETELAAIHHELKNQAGGNIMNGVSSRGMTLIAVSFFAVCGVCYIVNRWDRNRSNRIITERAVRKVNGGDN